MYKVVSKTGTSGLASTQHAPHKRIQAPTPPSLPASFSPPPPSVAAIKAGKDICLANKETLIAGGPFVLPLAQQHGVNILPADSEHSAIFQVMQGLPEGGLRR